MTAQRIALLRRAIRAHSTRHNRVAWLRAIAFLRSRGKWLVDAKQPRVEAKT